MRRQVGVRSACSSSSSSSSSSTTMGGVGLSRRGRSWRGLAVFAVVILAAGGAIAVTQGRPTPRSRLPAASVLPHMRSTTERRRSSSALPLRRSASAAINGGGGVSMAAATLSVVSRRRQLVGPGSSPPTCWARCGRCTPCRAVRVAIQPGIGTQWEYYPEVWRCKCGSKLFMP